jgi:hypothetical protein
VPWKKGESGNPQGRQVGVRSKITNAFLKDLEADWRQYGVGAIAAGREKDPIGYVKVVAALLPKQIEAEVKHSLADFLRSLDQPDAADVAPEPADIRTASTQGNA